MGKADLNSPALQAFIARAHKRTLGPKYAIVRAGDEPNALYLILEGSVSVVIEDTDGREIVLAYLSPGDFFGEMCLFPDQKTRTAGVRSRTATLLAEMGYLAFRAFNNEYPEIMFDVAGQLAMRLRETSRRLSDLAFLDVAGRVSHALHRLMRMPDSKTSPRGTTVRVSRQELARIVGCSREMAGRVLKRLEDDGVITCQGRSVLVYGDGEKLFVPHQPP